MWTFQYKHGDRPLEGYTIERGAGRGGFGEVYYAISDSGREVALKVISAYEQIELRGISNCMNLKNPHLVSIFDVKYNEAGRPFVIMEFVAGPSLRQLLDESPSGLGTQKAAFFLREMGKGLTFLHDNGIVHRDLKPANIFYENGYVKIGDYGLSKLISPTQHSAQTVTVGTVHYMAPEVGVGKYDRGIDIYALGAVLYEMLTGMVPFNGATPSEILLKHLGTDIDVSQIPEPFATVIKKAMAKDPTQRYQSVQEMVEAVFGAEHIRQSVSVFSPDELSVIAGHAALRAATAAGAGAGGSGGANAPAATATATGSTESDPWLRVGAWADRFTDRIAGVGGRAAEASLRAVRPSTTSASSKTMEVAPFDDPLSRGQRKMIAVVVAVALAVVAGIFAVKPRQAPIIIVPFVALAILGGATGIQIALRRMLPAMLGEAEFVRKLATGGMATLIAALFSLPFAIVMPAISPNIAGTWAAIFVPLFFMNVSAWASPDREERVSFWDTAFLAGLFGFIVSTALQGSSSIGSIAPAGICLVTQILSPWNKQAALARAKREENEEKQEYQKKTTAWPNKPLTAGAPATTGPNPPPLPGYAFPRIVYWSRPVRGYVRIIWLALAIISFAIGVSMLVAAGLASRLDFGIYLGNGLGFLWGSLLFAIQACRSRFYGWWSYFFRPLVVMAAGVSVIAPIVVIATERMRGEEMAVAVFFMIMGLLTICAVWFIPSGRRISDAPMPSADAPPQPPTTSPVEGGFWYRRRSRRRFRRIRGIPAVNLFLSLITGPLLLAAIAATLIAGLHLPQAVYWGIPDPQLAHDLNTQVFPDYSDWPRLIETAARTIGILLTLLAMGLCTLGRRRGGFLHVLRGLLGIAALIGSFALLGEAFRRVDWWSISVDVHANRIATGVASFFNCCNPAALTAAAIVFVASQIILLWHVREPREIPADQPVKAGAS